MAERGFTPEEADAWNAAMEESNGDPQKALKYFNLWQTSKGNNQSRKLGKIDRNSRDVSPWDTRGGSTAVRRVKRK